MSTSELYTQLMRVSCGHARDVFFFSSLFHNRHLRRQAAKRRLIDALTHFYDVTSLREANSESKKKNVFVFESFPRLRITLLQGTQY